MSGSTTELSLATAVDADDNADYLTINLANSLRTLDGLFNNVTGHTHGGAHQGGPITPAAGSITSAMIADGTIATADLANNAVTNAKLGTDTARLNLLTNGGFEIWQRGNGPFSANNAYTADRWAISLGGTSTVSISRNTVNQDAGSVACAAITYTHNATSALYQKIEDVRQLAGKTISVSVRAQTSTANAVQVTVSDGVGSAASSFHSGSGTYQTLTLTYTVASNATFLNINIGLFASCVVVVDNAMLVVGSVPTDYAPLHPADDLARCLRYYETIGASGGNSIFPAFVYGTTVAGWMWPFKVQKAVAPTITTTPAATFAVLGATATNIAGTSISTAILSVDKVQGQCSVASGLVAGNASFLSAATGQTAVIYAEANP